MGVKLFSLYKEKMANYRKRPVKKRVYKRKTYKKKGTPNTASLVKLIKPVNIRQSESKYKTTSYTWGPLDHDYVYKTDIWSNTVNLFPGQGTTDATRVGDRIVCQGIMLRAVFDIPWDRKNCKLKAFFIPWNSDQGSPDTYENLFHSITQNSRLDPVQKKRYPGMQYLGTYQIERERAPFNTNPTNDAHTPAANVISTNTGTICIKKWIPMYNKKLFFRSDATNQPSNLKEVGSIVLAPYATINTTITDHIVLSGEMSATVYYKDL